MHDSLSYSFSLHSSHFNLSILLLYNAVIVIVLFLALLIMSQQPAKRVYVWGKWKGREDQDSEARFLECAMLQITK